MKMAMENRDGSVRLLKQQAGDMALDQIGQEIEQAIDRVKRREADKVWSIWSDRRWRR